MRLEDFVSQTLVELTRGVQRAQLELKSTGARVNPAMSQVFGVGTVGVHAFGWADGGQDAPVMLVDFDVAVTASEGTETKGGMGIAVGTIVLGSQGKSDKGSSSESRIRFSVPLLLPNDKV